MSLTLGSRHLGDEDLIRYMDHQLDHEGMRLMGVHLRTCADCAARLEAMRGRSATVREWLSLLPAEMPDPNKRAVALAAVDRARFRSRASGPLGNVGLKAAAVALLLFGGLLGTQTGRAWVAGGVLRLAGDAPGPVATRLVEWLGEEPQPEVATLAPATVVKSSVQASGRPAEEGEARPAPVKERARAARSSGASAPVQFAPQGEDVSLVFQSLQEGGSATLWIRDVPSASGQVTKGLQGERLVPTLDGLEVRNRAESRADYVVVVPTRFRFVRVRVGDGPEMVIRISRAKQDWIWTINLRNSALE